MMRKTLDDIKTESKEIWLDKYDIKSIEYRWGLLYVTYYCKDCDEEQEHEYKIFISKGCAYCRGTKLNKYVFIRKFIEKYGNLYNYSQIDKINRDGDRISIICNTCQTIFKAKVITHLKGFGCPKCKKLEELRQKSFQQHGKKFNITSIYIKGKGTKSIVFILAQCNDCCEKINIRAHMFFRIGCKACNGEKINRHIFIQRAIKRHGKGRYDYSKVREINGVSDKVTIICNKKKCGDVFIQLVNNHMQGMGCPNCSKVKRYTLDEIIKKAKNIHGDKYNYDNSTYVNVITKTKILCVKCNKEFEQTWHSHTNKKQGCFRCHYSKGERAVARYLDESKIEYEEQKTFEGLKYKRALRLDFYIPSKKFAIEFDGIYHYDPNCHLNHGNFELRQKCDCIRNEYCTKNNITMIRLKDQDLCDLRAILDDLLK